jgi:hypothetical protein
MFQFDKGKYKGWKKKEIEKKRLNTKYRKFYSCLIFVICQWAISSVVWIRHR